jgi:26S proteasome regulatory subunit N7
LPKLSAGKRLDAHLELARVQSFWGDHRGYGTTLSDASRDISKGGDWDRRNRLKVYRALSFLLVRDVPSACGLLVEGIATFTCAELCDYPEYVSYAIVAGLLSLKRTELKKSIIDGSEVLQVAKDIPVLVSFCICFLSVCIDISSSQITVSSWGGGGEGGTSIDPRVHVRQR